MEMSASGRVDSCKSKWGGPELVNTPDQFLRKWAGEKHSRYSLGKYDERAARGFWPCTCRQAWLPGARSPHLSEIRLASFEPVPDYANR